MRVQEQNTVRADREENKVLCTGAVCGGVTDAEYRGTIRKRQNVQINPGADGEVAAEIRAFADDHAARCSAVGQRETESLFVDAALSAALTAGQDDLRAVLQVRPGVAVALDPIGHVDRRWHFRELNFLAPPNFQIAVRVDAENRGAGIGIGRGSGAVKIRVVGFAEGFIEVAVPL